VASLAAWAADAIGDLLGGLPYGDVVVEGLFWGVVAVVVGLALVLAWPVIRRLWRPRRAEAVGDGTVAVAGPFGGTPPDPEEILARCLDAGDARGAMVALWAGVVAALEARGWVHPVPGSTRREVVREVTVLAPSFPGRAPLQRLALLLDFYGFGADPPDVEQVRAVVPLARQVKE